MNPAILWNALRKNISLVLLLVAATCPALAVGQVVRGVSWTLLMPVALVAVLCGWGAGRSRLSGRQAAAGLVALGLPAVFIYVVKLVGPLGNFVISVYSLVPQIISWLTDRTPLDPARTLEAWNDLSSRILVALLRLGEWVGLLIIGKTAADPESIGLALSILFWLVGIIWWKRFRFYLLTIVGSRDILVFQDS